MAKAIKEPTIEEYMDIVKEQDMDRFNKFIDESFGTEEDFDREKAREFAQEALPVLEDYMRAEIAKAEAHVSDMPDGTSVVETEAKEVKTEEGSDKDGNRATGKEENQERKTSDESASE